MSLSASEKAAVLSVLGKISPKANDLGAEFINRLFTVYPLAKRYFHDFDLTPGSSNLKTHSAKIINALKSAANRLNDPAGNLSALTDQDANQIRMDPGTYGMLSRVILEVLDSHFPGDFTPKVQVAWEKFLALAAPVFTK